MSLHLNISLSHSLSPPCQDHLLVSARRSVHIRRSTPWSEGSEPTMVAVTRTFRELISVTHLCLDIVAPLSCFEVPPWRNALAMNRQSRYLWRWT
jgi:hypothetical protein